MLGKPQRQGKSEGTRDSGPPLANGSFANWSFGTHTTFFLDARCQNGGRAASPAQKVLLVLIRKKCCLFAIKDKKENGREKTILLHFFSPLIIRYLGTYLNICIIPFWVQVVFTMLEGQ